MTRCQIVVFSTYLTSPNVSRGIASLMLLCCCTENLKSPTASIIIVLNVTPCRLVIYSSKLCIDDFFSLNIDHVIYTHHLILANGIKWRNKPEQRNIVHTLKLGKVKEISCLVKLITNDYTNRTQE